jgi:uncharacterized membrane protein
MLARLRHEGTETMPAIFARLRSHIITGFIFVMPVLVTVAVIMKFWIHLLNIGGKCSRLLRVDTVLGPSGDAVMGVVVFLLVCVVAGYLVRVSFMKRLSERMDRQLETVIPGYGQLRSETKRKIGAETEKEPIFEACLVKVHDLWQPGYVVEENPDGTQTVFVPQAPALGRGQVYVAHPGQLKKLGMDSTALNTRLKNLGKGMMKARVVPKVAPI